jgi:hypothetical protein
MDAACLSAFAPAVAVRQSGVIPGGVGEARPLSSTWVVAPGGRLTPSSGPGNAGEAGPIRASPPHRLGGTSRQPFVEPGGYGLLHRVTLGGPQASIQLGVQRLELVLDPVRVWPLTFLRIRLPSASNPSETTPRQRPEQVLW